MGTDAVTLKSPVHCTAALPYLLGFQPESSVIVIASSTGPAGPARVVVTARFDLPTESDADPYAEVLATQLSSLADTAIVVITDGPSIATAPTDLPRKDVASALGAALSARGVSIQDVLYTDNERVWSYLCTDPLCRCQSGELITKATRDEVAAEFIALGRAPVKDRAALDTELTPVEGATPTVTPANVVQASNTLARDRLAVTG